MKGYRSRFEENYRAVPEPCPGSRRGVKVRYVYIGLWYRWNLPPERARRSKWVVGAAFVLTAALFFAGGLADSPLNYARYVQLPGTLSIAALVFEAFGAVQFCAAKERMTSLDFRDIRAKLLLAPLAHGVLLLCAAAAAALQMAQGGFTGIGGAVLLCYCCSGVLSLLLWSYVRSLPYQAERNENTGIGLDGPSIH